MARWRKLLERMANDPSPRNYTYDEAVQVLRGLDFTMAPHGAGSHRVWRGLSARGVVVIGLVDKGHGKLKPYLIREMVKQLREHGYVT